LDSSVINSGDYTSLWLTGDPSEVSIVR
jgi:hypothetical protein